MNSNLLSILNIAICTHNRANLLKQCLESIISDATSYHGKLRIIVVDNNSSDSTAAIVAKFKDQFHSQNIEIISEFEPRTGKIYALNRVFQNVFEGHTLFLDDDNELTPGTLGVIQEHTRLNPNAILGSENIAILQTTAPFWFNEFSGAYACGKQDDHFKLTLGIWGAGIVCPSKHLQFLAKQSFAFSAPGRKGKKLTSGSDSEITLVMQMLGATVVLPKSYKIRHHISTDRLKITYLLRLAFNFGRTDTFTDPYKLILSGTASAHYQSQGHYVKRHLTYIKYNFRDLTFQKMAILKFCHGLAYNFGFIYSMLTNYPSLVKNYQKIRTFCAQCATNKSAED